jgi:hypothetical protein
VNGSFENGMATQKSASHPPIRRRVSDTTLSWRQGDTIPLNAERTLRVLGVRCDSTEDTMRHSPEGFGRERAGKAQPAIRGKE